MSKDNGSKQSKNSKTFSMIMMIIFLIIAFVGSLLMMSKYWNKDKANEVYEDLASSVNDVPASSENMITISEDAVVDQGVIVPTDPTLTYYGVEIPDKLIDWDALHEVNEDIYAWLCVPGTLVDYPVLQHPTDNSYYLMHNMDGSYGYPACIYTENYNSKDFSDYNTVIYGHNMKDGTMFASLHYFETMDLTNINNFIYIYTEDEIRVYLIVAAYQFESKHLLLDYDMDNIYVYEQYLKDMFKLTSAQTGGVYNVREETELNMADRIVTLSTCVNNHDAEYRYLVVGKYLTSVPLNAE